MSVNTYIQGHDEATLKSHQSRTAEKQADYLLPYIRPGHAILDVGCGPGTITCSLAKYAPEGTITGVDYSDKVIEKARLEAKRQNIVNVQFQTANAHELPFANESFDIVHCHAVLVHVPNAKEVLREMRRVCKKGGYVAAREPDWDTCVIYPHDPILERWKTVSAQLKQREGAEPNAGRHLAAWAITAGFPIDQIQVTSDTLQYFGKEATTFWGELYAARTKTEFGKRAVEAGFVTQEEIDQFGAAYLAWSRKEAAIWAMMHMKLLCQNE